MTTGFASEPAAWLELGLFIVVLTAVGPVLGGYLADVSAGAT